MASDVNDFLQSYVVSSLGAGALVIASRLPPALAASRAPLTYVGVSAYEGRIDAPDYEAYVRPTNEAVTAALSKLLDQRGRTYQFVLIDLSHHIEDIVEQINEALRAATTGAVFVFPGAAPPQRGMATREPTQDWWVGDVWTLRQVLADSGCQTWTSSLAPTGLLVATGLTRLDPEKAAATSRRLQAEIARQEDFEAWFDHSSLAMLADVLDFSLGRLRDAARLRVVVDPREPGRQVRAELDREAPWTRKPPVAIVDLSGRGLDTAVLRDDGRVRQGERIDRFQDVYLCGRDVILKEDSATRTMEFYGKNWAPSSAGRTLRGLADEPPSEDDAATFLTREDGEVRIERSRLAGALELPGEVFLGTPDEYSNFGMWLLYSVPGVRWYRNNMAGRSFVASLQKAWQRRLLVDLGVDQACLAPQTPGKLYRADAVTTLRQSFRSLALTASDVVAFDEVAAKALTAGEAGTAEKIFVSRLGHTRSGAYRGLTNEEELIAQLVDAGFLVVEPESLPILAQAKLFHQARVVVGLGGAGMFNVAFCRPQALVVDIESGLGFVDSHANLFASRGVDYALVLGREDETDERDVQRRWTIDVAGVMQTLRQLM